MILGPTGVEVARYMSCMRSGPRVAILGLTGGEGGKILEVYEKRDWWCDVGT